jgi:hypothetical protein
VSIFTAATDEVTPEALRLFLLQQIPESINLEYKAAWTPQLMKSIAAMSNTVGGLILLGVAEQNGFPDPEPAGVALAERDSLTNRCWTSFDAPFVPEIIGVPVGDQKFVLVIRVDAARVQRPVFFEGRVFVRLPGRNAQASRAQVQALFAEAAGAGAGPILHGVGNYLPRHAHPMLTHEEEGLGMRVGVSALVPPSGIAVLGTAIQKQIGEILEQSALERLIREMSHIVDARTSAGWQREGAANRSSIITLVRDRVRSIDEDYFVRGQCVLEAPYGPARGGVITLLVGAALEPAVDPIRPAFVLEELYRTVHVLLATALDEIAARIFPQITGSGLWEPIGPAIAFDPGNAWSLTEFVQFDGVRPVPGAHPLAAATYDAPHDLDLRDRGVRDEAVREWLVRVLLDGGYEGAEERVAHLRPIAAAT